MPIFVTTHLAPGLSADEVAANAPSVAESVHARFRHLFVNMFTGQLFSVYEAEDEATLEREFERLGFPYDQVTEVQFALDADGLAALLASSPATAGADAETSTSRSAGQA